eukprot:Blabericola_migrator_1__13359@NODE_947_length_5922_cov_60_770623_g657_i0_p4_GENE_NODE_947_length_5922_cov_60_770623_g657_i0NODE_947_length_5922_cov_60_770623_g657_i0_p4_ORF_typecomplete_len281_score47_00DUF5111/PF17138_4/0_26DUF5111/PF17138_4/1_6e03_NODE_947_length_5922_cov_60_770623_g657_i068910
MLVHTLTSLLLVLVHTWRLRDQLPSGWDPLETYRIFCPDGRGKGRCHLHCWRHGLKVTLPWLQDQCLPHLEFDDTITLERTRQYIPRWQEVRWDGNDWNGVMIDTSNTTLRQEILNDVSKVVRVSLYMGGTEASGEHVYNATDEDPIKEVGGFAYFPDGWAGTATEITYPPEYSHVIVDTSLYQGFVNLTQTFNWWADEMPDQWILAHYGPPFSGRPFIDVEEWTNVRQTEKCSRFKTCEACQDEVNCEWCLLPSLQWGCTSLCAEPWLESVCGTISAAV